MGRSIKTVRYGEDGKQITTESHYDEMGRNYLVEGPWKGGKPAMVPFVETLFDGMGRPQMVIAPVEGGRTGTTEFVYHTFSTTVIDPDNRAKQEIKDYLGRLVAVVEDPAGDAQTTRYTYNAAGDLLTVTDAKENLTAISYDSLGRKTAMLDPDMGEWLYEYDENGNLVAQRDNKHQTTTYSYDELNRITRKEYSSGEPTVTYAYDLAVNGIGRLYSVSSSVATTTHVDYDTMGQPLTVRRQITGDEPRETGYAYDLVGRTTSVRYPGGYTVYNSFYPGSGLLRAVSDSNGLVLASYSGYAPSGKMGRITYGNGVTTDFYYNTDSTRLTDIVTAGPAGQLQFRSYQYSDAGNIAGINDRQHGAFYEYTYDSLHRLSAERKNNDPDQNATVYDAIGNILSKQSGATVMNYIYGPNPNGANDKPHAVKVILIGNNEYPMAHDPNGNMTAGWDFSDPTNPVAREMEYNADNMPVVIRHGNGEARKTTLLAYDGNGARVKKNVSDGPTTYYVGAHFEVENGTTVLTVFGGGQRIAQMKNGALTYFHQDHLGSTTVMTDHQGNMVASQNFTPYGEMRNQTGSPATVSNRLFTGQELDPENGLYNYNARLYDPVTGMFISADTIVPNFSDPQSLNRYMYCRGNPLVYTDPSGHLFGIDDILIGAIIGAAIGGMTSAITGGDIGMGILTGTISGAFFGAAGGFIDNATQAGITLSNITQAGIHAGAGALSGGINSSLTGGDIGLGMAIGGVSAGIGKFSSPHLQDLEKIGEFGGRSLIGGIMGGVAAELYGNDFGLGFQNGALSAGIATICNDFMHDYLRNRSETRNFFYEGPTRLSRTLLGFITSGGVSKTFHTVSPLAAMSRALFPPQGLQGNGISLRTTSTLGIGGTIRSAGAHLVVNSAIVMTSLEVGIAAGSLVSSIQVPGTSQSVGNWIGSKTYDILQ